MELKFANGKKIEVENPQQSAGIVRGANRELVSFMVAEAQCSFDKIKGLFMDSEAIKTMVLTNPHDIGTAGTALTTVTYEGYLVHSEPWVQTAVMNLTGDHTKEPEMVFIVTLGKLTVLEELMISKMGLTAEQVLGK